MQYLLRIRNIIFYCVSVVLFSNCASNSTKTKQKAEIIRKLEDKIEKGTLTFDDVYYSKYGEYDELTEDTEEELKGLVSKLKEYSQGVVNNDGKTIKIDADKIIDEKLDKLVRILADKNNLHHAIYGTVKEVWLPKDKNAMSPLNYFQTHFLYQISGEELIKLSVELLKFMLINTNPQEANPGILWILYGKDNQLVEAFDVLRGHIDYCDAKTAKGQVLTKQEEKALREIIDIGNVKYLQTDGVIEYFAKKELVAKAEELLFGTDKIIERNNKLKNGSQIKNKNITKTTQTGKISKTSKTKVVK